MKITFEGTYAEIKQEMQDFLAGAATPVEEVKQAEEVTQAEEVKKKPERKSAPAQEEPVVYDDPAQKIDYPPRTKAETQALMREVIKKPQGRETAIALLARFGATKFKDLAEKHYAEFYVGLESVK